MMKLSKTDTGLLFTDPQNDALSERGKGWPLLGESIKENHTIDNMEKLFKAAKQGGYPVFISPHYFYPFDQGWQIRDPMAVEMLEGKMYLRTSPLSLEGFAGSGADWLDRFKPYIEDGKTVVASPHKLYGPQNNDLVLHLREHGIKQVILGGMLANMCVESHLRHLVETGFSVIIAKDATAGPRHPQWGDGYKAALINYPFLSHHVLPTAEIVAAMK